MFKLVILLFAALFVISAGRPSYFASSPVIYSSHYVKPVVRAHHYTVPVVKTLVRTPIVYSHPVVHSVAAPVYHTYGAVPVVRSYNPAFSAWKS